MSSALILSGNRVRLKRQVLSDWAAITSDRPWLEVGGIVLGEPGTEEEPSTIHCLSGPGPNAKRRIFSFEPDTAFTQHELERWWYETDGQVTFLGDWHTHPCGALAPSKTDLDALAKMAMTPSFGIATPLSLIFRPRPLTRSRNELPVAVYKLKGPPYETERMSITLLES